MLEYFKNPFDKMEKVQIAYFIDEPPYLAYKIGLMDQIYDSIY